MKKQLIRVLALTLAPLFLACGALASDVPTCPLISWDEYVASSGGWAAAGAYDASSCGASAASGSGSSSGICQSAGGLRWDTGVSSCPSASASQGSSSCGGFQLGPAFERDVRFTVRRRRAPQSNNACSGGVYALASCGTCGSTACDGTRCPGQSYTQDENCIFSFGSENDCQTSACQHPSTDYTAQSVSPQESALYQMINDERVANGVSALPLDTELSAIAREKSEDMIENGYFAHESPDLRPCVRNAGRVRLSVYVRRRKHRPQRQRRKGARRADELAEPCAQYSRLAVESRGRGRRKRRERLPVRDGTVRPLTPYGFLGREREGRTLSPERAPPLAFYLRPLTPASAASAHLPARRTRIRGSYRKCATSERGFPSGASWPYGTK